MGDDIVIVTVRGLFGEGSWPLEVGVAHLQRGFYMNTDPKEPEIDATVCAAR
jgi:hypothetical protein